MRQFGAILFGVLGAFVLGALLFNFVLMPRLVQHGLSVPVPAVEGLSRHAAEQSCAAAGLRLQEEDRRHSDTLPADHVVAQSPAAGTAVKPGRTVRVTISLGQEQVLVPPLRGMTVRQAELALENAHLTRGRVAEVHSGSVGPMVRASRPGSGAEAALGDSVDLLVATGDATDDYLMPSLLGQDLNDVRALAESRGFRLVRVTYRTARGVYPGTVLEQKPQRGSLVQRGDAIDLVVSTPD